MTNSRTPQKVIVAMSGGVDSSVAALLLKDQGFEVIGVTLQLLPRGKMNNSLGCCGSSDDLAVAKRAAEKIGIPHYVLDYSSDFHTEVVQHFIDSYIRGETPNPCLECNRSIKFARLKKFAKSIGAAYLATGHYARIVEASRLFESTDSQKDQSYVLFTISREDLASIYFPVGDATKPFIRELAEKFGLPNAQKKDSQEICFVPDRDYRSFVLDHFQKNGADRPATLAPGPITNSAGQAIGEHKGVAFYTIGQRSGLVVKGDKPVYVSHLDPTTNTVVVGSDRENLSSGLWADRVSWIAGVPPGDKFSALVKIRYKHEPAPAQIQVANDHLEVHFDEPQRAVSPGQAAVIYRWDEKLGAREVLGGGKITKSVI